MYTYTIEEAEVNGQFVVKRVDENGDATWIPADPLNADYQAYLVQAK